MHLPCEGSSDRYGDRVEPKVQLDAALKQHWIIKYGAIIRRSQDKDNQEKTRRTRMAIPREWAKAAQLLVISGKLDMILESIQTMHQRLDRIEDRLNKQGKENRKGVKGDATRDSRTTSPPFRM